MAAEGIKKVVTHVTCSVCHELYKKPKYLSCHHSYCEECLAKIQKGSDITCPECKKTNTIPTGGVKLLPDNFLINRIVEEVTLNEKVAGEEEVRCDVCIRDDPAVILCFDCGVLLCSHCYEYHKYNKEYNGHNMQQLKELREEKKDINIQPKAKLMLCQEHEMELNFYCDTCDQLVCHYCTMTDHNGHDHNTVKRMANKHRVELEEIVEPVEEMITGLSQAHQKVMANQEKIQLQITEASHQIDDYYEQLQRMLLQQKEDLKKELHKVFTHKKKAISMQLQEIGHIQAQLRSTKELNNAVKNGSDQEALFVKRQVTDDVKRLTDCYKTLKIEPVQLVSNMLFCPVKEFQDSFPQFANIFYGDAVPFNSSVENIPSLAYANKNVKFIIVTKNAEGSLCAKGGSKVIAQARSSNTGDSIPVAIRDNKDGSYFASFVSNEAGEVRLSVNINGKHIKGSPCSVSVRRNYLAVNTPNKIVNLGGRMGEPWGIAFGKDGVWAVTDHSDHCVYIFDGEDQLITKFGSKGIGVGQFHCPAGLAFDADNHLYVVCRYNHRVQKFLVNGEYVLQFSYKGTRNGQLDCPLGITVHNERVYIADQCNGCVTVFHCDGKFSQTIGLANLSTAIFDLAINGSNQLLVADKRNHCISIFTLDGSYVGKIGTKGTDKGQLYCPAGVAVDEYGCILVIEGVNHRVSIFDKDGVFIHCFGSKGFAEGQFHTNESLGIALSPDGSIYISDYYNKRIQIYSNF